MDYILLGLFVLVLLLGFWFGYRASGKPSLLDMLSGLDRERQLLLLTLVGVVVSVTSTVGLICLVIFRGIVDPVVIALVSGFIGSTSTAMVITTYNFWFGSSNGSQLKDAQPKAAVVSTLAGG